MRISAARIGGPAIPRASVSRELPCAHKTRPRTTGMVSSGVNLTMPSRSVTLRSPKSPRCGISPTNSFGNSYGTSLA
jgi:hypothetical protein